MVTARLRSLLLVLRQQPYEAAVGLVGISGLLELVTASGSAAASAYPAWLLYSLGALLFAGGLLTVGGLLGSGLAFGDVARVLARRVEQCGQYLLCGSLTALGSAAVSFGLRGLITGSVDLALGCAALARAVTISRVIVRAGRDDTPWGDGT